MKKLLVLLLFLASFSAYSQKITKWNNWTDRESLRSNLEKAARKGKTYFSTFRFYDYTKYGDLNSSVQPKDLGHPFMYAMDFYQAMGNYMPEKMIKAQKHNIAAVVKEAWKNTRAIPVCSWHLHNPYAVYSDFKNRMGCRYRVFEKGYPAEHRFVINEILNNKQVDTLGIGRLGDWFDAQVREVADYINTEFVDENGKPIPFIFRLWHEQEDSWQWWGFGEQNPKRMLVNIEDYIAFWRLTVDKFRKYCPEAQILWCYCPDRYFRDEKTFMVSYPGDDVVDIIAYDDYEIGRKNKKNTSVEEFMKIVTERARIVSKVAKDHGKIAMMAETNCMDPEIKDLYFKTVETVLTDKDVHLAVFQLWCMSYYKDQTMEFLNNRNIIFNK